MSGPAYQPKGRDDGFTLVELLAALAVFGLLAIMGVQTLNGTVRAQSQLQGIEARGGELTRMLTLLRADLDAAAPLDFLPPSGLPQPPVYYDVVTQTLSLTTAGRPRLPDEKSAGVTRVSWRFDPLNQRLLRDSWPLLHPASDAARRETMQILQEVTRMEIEVFIPESGWVRAELNADEHLLSQTLPAGISVSLETKRHGRLRVAVAF
ncbi:MAG: type II secretion system protein GspJ [Brevirhabdus sp.]